jgi:subtilisin-like proprotein convertase family protein
MNLPGTLSALSGTPEVSVRAQVPGIGFLESASGVLEITPTEPGEVTAWIIKEGFVLYSEVFPIVTQPSAHGIVTLYGEPDHSGVAITAEPGGYTTVTAADGTWHLLNLEVGTYQITAVKEGWSTGNGEVTVAEGEHVTGINFALSQVYRANLCAQPNLEVPSAPSSGASSSMTCVEGGSIDWVRVYVDVSYGWIGYLDVKLTSPSGTTVMLHNQSGGSADDIVGWYPDELTSASDLAAFNGEDLYGDWTLTVQAFAYGAIATLNEWCLEISYSPAMSSAGDRDLPKELVLDANYPNPFNPMTTISFALPQATHVQLRVYDLQGKLVATLADGTLTAGRHETIWTGRDDAGRQTASGMYFYRLIADGQTRSGKMLLLK